MLRGENRGRRGDAIEIGEDAELELARSRSPPRRRARRRPRCRRLVVRRRCAPSAASRAAASSVFFFTWRSRFFSIVARPRVERACAHVDHRDIGSPRLREHVRDAVPHLSRADDRDAVSLMPSSRRGPVRRLAASRRGDHAPRPANRMPRDHRPARRAAPPSGPHEPPVSPVGPRVVDTIAGNRQSACPLTASVQQGRHRPVPREMRHPRGVQSSRV